MYCVFFSCVLNGFRVTFGVVGSSVSVILSALSCWLGSLVLVFGPWIYRAFDKVKSSPFFSTVQVSDLADMTWHGPVIL